MIRLADFIDRLLEIQNKYDCDDVYVDMMQEHCVDINGFEKEVQFNSKVKDVAVSCGKNTVNKIIIIGQEID